MVWPFKDSSIPEYADVCLEEGDVVLRPAQKADYQQWHSVRFKNQSYLKPYEPAWPQESLSEKFFQRRVENLKIQWRNDKSYSFLIFQKNGGRLVGGINVNNVCRGAAQYAALGYWLSQEDQGKGYMTMAGQAALHFSFTHLFLQRMNAATLSHNEKSKNLLHRLGFVEEGFARKYVQIDGQRQDHVLFGLNADEFISALRPARF